MKKYIGLMAIALIFVIQYFDKDDKLLYVQYGILISLAIYAIYIYFKDKKSE